MRLLFLLTILLFFTACWEDKPEPVKITQYDKLTPVEYTYETPETNFEEGYQGIIRIFANHIIEGEDSKGNAIRLAISNAGTGNVIFYDNKLLIFTAKHVISTDPSKKRYTIRIGKETEDIEDVQFKSIKKIENQIIIGELAVVPINVYLSKDIDFAILEIDPIDYSYIHRNIDKLYDKKIDIKSSTDIVPGDVVGCWGFPSTNTAQMKKLNVTSQKGNNYFINSSLKGGYSGGPVFKKTKKNYLVGMIIRSISASNHSMLIKWDLVIEHINNVGKEKFMLLAQLNKSIKIESVSIKFTKRFQ